MTNTQTTAQEAYNKAQEAYSRAVWRPGTLAEMDAAHADLVRAERNLVEAICTRTHDVVR